MSEPVALRTEPVADIDIAALGDEVVAYPYRPGHGLPLFVEPRSSRMRSDMKAVAHWFAVRKPVFDRLLATHGACFLRGFPIEDTAAFSALVSHYPSTSFGYAAGATSRQAVAGRVFEATRAPAEFKLDLHQEMAYLPHYPKQLAFYCHVAAATGGETIIADYRRLQNLIAPRFLQEVKTRGVLYTRNLRAPGTTLGHVTLDAFHRTWSDAFFTDDRTAIGKQCEQMGLGHRWEADDSLSITYRTSGFAQHSLTGDSVWFNQIATQSITAGNLGQAFCDLYKSHFKPGQHPFFHTTYGDGSTIAPSDIDSLYPLMDEVTVGVPWQHADVMLLDNIYTAHGRNPFTGTRDVQVALLT
jgi:hypothetical protein